MEGTKMMPDRCLNLVLLGGMGVGKSASGNTILGRQAFSLKKSSTSVTQNVAAEVREVCGLHITVYDTPGFSGAESKEELGKYEEVLQKCESGHCLFLLVLQPDRFTEEEQKPVDKIEELLGEKRLKKTWIIFTRGDQLENANKTIDKVIDENEALKKLTQKYEDRFHVFNNKEGHLPRETLPRILININDIPPESRSSRRIVLLGKTGVGKSAAGNMILEQKVFRSKMRMNSVTRECSEAHNTLSDRSVSVVDTPGLFDTQMKPEDLVTEIAKSVYLSSPGPHTFLIVFPVNMRFTEHEQQIPQQIEQMFGEEVLKYSIILFTHGDQLEEETIEEIIEESQALRDLVQKYGGRFHVFSNKDQNNREQVNDLLQKIDTMIEQNGGGHYSNQMFEDAYRFRQEEEERRKREEEERKQQEEKQRQEKIERVRKETGERVRAECETELKKEEERVRAECEAELTGLQKFVKKYEKNLTFAAGLGSQGAVCGACIGGLPGAVVVSALTAAWGFFTAMLPPNEPFYIDLP